MMQLGAEGVFVGSGIFKSEDPATPRGGDRRGDDALPGRRARRARLRGPRPGDDLARDAQARGAAAPRQPRLVSAPLVGVLALQGDFEAHAAMLRGLGAEVREVRVPADLEGLDGLVIPGGESTTMTLGIAREGLAEPLRALVRSGTPVLGTCAGMIMLDREHLGLADYTVQAQRVRPPDPLLRGRPRDPRRRRRAGARRLHPRAVDRRARRRRRGARRGRRPRRRRAPGQHARDLVPPGDRGRDAPARAVPAGHVRA